MFQVGGTDVLIHKYLGVDTSNAPGTPSQPKYDETNPFQIQDLLFLENRDRKYDPDVYIMRGVYNLQDTDFNLSQFGLFLQNDTIFITFHINDTIEKKLTLSKLQSTIWEKSNSSKEESFTLSDFDDDMLQNLIKKDVDKNNDEKYTLD
jgi:hypothetical protein